MRINTTANGTGAGISCKKCSRKRIYGNIHGIVKSNEHWLKERFMHRYPDTLYYLLIDGEFRGAAAGKFRYTPEVEDVILDLPDAEAFTRKDDIIRSVHVLCGANNPIKRYLGEEI